MGITSLIGWNAILTSLDFFKNSFSNFNVYFLMGVPYFVGMNLFGVLMIWISKILKVKFRIYGAFIIASIIMFILPI